MKLELSKRAKKDIRLFSPEEQIRIASALDRLRSDPRSCDFKKLKGQESSWRLRIGDLRAIIDYDKQAQVYYVVAIKPRGAVYR